jgi:hypothetical protein
MHKFWFCVSGGGCITSFITATEPYLQYLAILVSIAAGIASYRASKRKG